MNDATNSTTGGQCFDAKPFGPACEAYRNLLGHQRQLDMDGVEVGVSRQALDQVLQAYAHLTIRRDDLIVANNGYRDRAIEAEKNRPAPAEEDMAKAIYKAQGHEDIDSWEACKQRRYALDMTPPYSATQLSCIAAAAAVLALWRKP